MTRQELLTLLTALCKAPGVSGAEDTAAAIACKALSAYCPDAQIRHGNVLGTCGSTDITAPHVLLDAHIDQVGLIVTSVTEDGFLTVGQVGGLDRRLLPAQRVTVHGKQAVPGVICCMPPHLTDGTEKALSWKEVRIDTGYPAQELQEIVQPGDYITFNGVAAEMPGGRFTAPALDDRCGVAAILYALDALKTETLPCRITVLFSTQEEVGERGAMIGAFAVDPDMALAVDVSFAGDGKRTKTGISGAGAMIGFSPSLSRRISDALVHAAIEEEILWQYEVMPGTTGTNADRFSVTREGIAACTVSIPLYNMHTPAESVDPADVIYTGELLAAFLRRCVSC